MKYHAQSDQLTVSHEQLRIASSHFYYAIRKIKETAGMPLHPYKRDGCLVHHDHAMCGIISAAQALGIDLGANWGNDIDSTNHG